MQNTLSLPGTPVFPRSSKPAFKILLIDDDPLLLQMVQEVLALDPYEVKAALRAQDGLALAADFQPDLIICDVNLPDRNGLDVCRQIKAASPAQSFIFLSGMGDEIDLVVGLESGADDYLVKPFRMKEFRARIRSVQRRLEHTQATQSPETPKLLRSQELELDLSACQASLAGVPVQLTHKEFELLHWLLAHPGQLFSRAHLLEHIWPDDLEISERSVDALVKRLRKKLADDAETPRFIETLRGLGYRFRKA
ncbi:MAG: response regulator transcription factor [Candidatus Sericytochromatia bacterium]